MECQECHNRPATVHFTQVINGNKTEFHLCEYCAQEKGYMNYDNHNFSFHNLLAGLFNMSSGHSLAESKSAGQKTNAQEVCDSCGMTYQQFARIGKFGCSNCYKAFNDHLNPIFRKVHSGNTKHEGKIPKRDGGNLHVKRKVEQLRYKLQDLIEKEKFEDAATLRDEIRELEKQLSNGKDGDA